MNYIVTLTLLVLVCIHSGESIQCWVCSSDYEPHCADPFNMTRYALTDCNRDRTHSPYLHSIAVCKKEKRKVPNGLVIVRSCNWVQEEPRDGSCEDNRLEYCSTCTHDACNSAVDVRTSAVLLLPMLAKYLTNMQA